MLNTCPAVPDQKQQGNSTAILIRPCKFGTLIRRGKRSSSIDNNNSSSLDSRQPPSTHTPVSSTYTLLGTKSVTTESMSEIP
ncbi:hypothetical protein F2Q68_00010590 [Brassica cretica]|uniref:Uncharacterized protein n=1 Tax=Brassica cretica TaxID=69181 RepID=A0A8S9KZ74_BRACR|nr:hypothetical protein F2Q68_00010590 [Brassica cretica]